MADASALGVFGGDGKRYARNYCGGRPAGVPEERKVYYCTTNDAVRRLRLPSPRVQPSHFTRRASFSTEIIKWRDFPNAIVSPLDNHS
jgi:hypothetical protein